MENKKLKVVECKKNIVETDITLPAYFYYQDEYCNDEYVKVEEKKLTTIKWDFNEVSLTIEYNREYNSWRFNEKNLATEKEYNYALDLFISKM